MLYRPVSMLFQADDKNAGGLTPPPPQNPNPNPANPNASGEEMPDWVSDKEKAWAEIQKLRKEAGDYRTARNQERDNFASLQKYLDERLPKTENPNPETDPVKSLEARIAAFEQQQKAAMETAARERLDAVKLKVATAVFGEKVGGENKAQALATLAMRLTGQTEEELIKDAQALAALLPNPQWQNSTTSASPSGRPVTETDQQRLERRRRGGDAKTSFD
jgi:hypothetical protein